MPTYEVTSPDGKTWDVTAPEGATQEQVLKYAQTQWAAQPKEPAAAVQAGNALNEIPRQVGLAARYAIEGPMQAAEIVSEPLRQFITDPIARQFVKPGVSDIVKGTTRAEGTPLGKMGAQFADFLGLPKPQGANERVIGDATRLLAGAGGLGGLGRVASSAPGMAGKVGQFFAANPATQLTSAAGAGLASGASREAGGSPLVQAGAGLLGGLAAPTALKAGTSAVRTVGNRLRPPQVQQVDNRINLTLQRAGFDWSGVDERTKQAVRADVAKALSIGDDLDAAALRRLVDFRSVGATPTRGTLTLDPVQITREKNLAKTAANSTDVGLQSLPRIENQNNRILIDRLNESGAARAPDPYEGGAQVIGSLQRDIDRSRANIGGLYSQARDSSGRSAQLDGAQFTQRANELLQENLAGKLPAQIEKAMNDIAMGRRPLTVDHAEQLKTVIARIQRGTTDGNERYSLGLIRQALDETPLRGAPQVNPGNLPAVPGTVPPSPAGLGQESIDAFNAARSANRQFMGRVEETPALEAVMNGAQPDQFIQQFVLNGTTRDVRNLRNSIDGVPETVNTIRASIADHLKRSALSGAADETGNFSQSNYNKALRQIGNQKLSIFFTPEEISRLRAVGRVASYTQFQPRGSAVNNSNSGALVLGAGLDFLSRWAPKVPVFNDTITGLLNGHLQSRAANVAPGLLNQSGPSFADRLGPAAIYGGLLSAQPINQR